MKRIQSVVLLLAAFTFLSTPWANAADVRVFVLAPIPPNSLKTVETQGSEKPLYSHPYSIPYKSVESQIRSAIKAQGDLDTGNQVVKCSGACPDAHWRVTVNTDFAFTKMNQPVIAAFGNPQENGVDVSLKTQFKLNINVHASVWIEPVTGKVEQTVNVPIELLIGLDAKSKLKLWPEIVSVASYCDTTKLQETACAKLTLDGKNIDLKDLKGVAIGLGTALGGSIGAIMGDPFGGLLVGALGSNAAVKIAEQKVQAEADKILNQIMQVASIRATWLASNYVDARATQANNIKAFLLNTKVPGLNKSYQELSTALGLSFDVQTTTSSSNVNVIVTPRFTAKAAGKKLTGKFRMPKEACVYMRSQWGYLPMKMVKVNQDLASKIGMSCASLLSAADMKMYGYLGANPTVVKVGGAPLPTWQAVGTPVFTGNLLAYTHGTGRQAAPGSNSRQSTGYYECSFEIANVPNADIIEAAFGFKLRERLTGFYGNAPSRYFEVAAAGPQIVLDDGWNVMSNGLVIGGEGQCTSGKVIAPHYQASSWLDRMNDLLDLDKCAACGIKLNEGMLEISNNEAVLQNPALKPMFNALQKGEALPAANKAAAAKQVQKTTQGAPALSPQMKAPGAQKNIETPR